MAGLFNNVCGAAVLGALGASGFQVGKNIYNGSYQGSQTISFIADLVICRFIVQTPFYQTIVLRGKSYWICTSQNSEEPLKEHARLVLMGAAIGITGRIALNIIHSMRF